MECGFYHPDRGYWQTNSEPSAGIIAGYPEGTIEVPVQPSALHRFDGAQWVAPTENDTLLELAAQARAQRNSLLAASDWTQVLDAPVDQADWATYRQALRDITAQAGFPQNVIWPTKP
jgi:hypothetical protein